MESRYYLENPGTEQITRDAVDIDGVGVETTFEVAWTFGGDDDAYANATERG